MRAAEAALEGKSIFAHDKNGKVAESYPEWNRREMTINIENPKKKSSIAYSCECILKITISFAIIIHSKRESGNRR